MTEPAALEVDRADLLRRARAKAMVVGYKEITGSTLPIPSDEEIEKQIRDSLDLERKSRKE